MNAGAKFAIGAVLIVGAVGYLMASGVKQTGQFFLTPSELSQRVAADPSFYNLGMKVGARVVPGTVARDPCRVRDVRRPGDGGVRARVGAVPPRLQRRVRRRLHQP